MENPALAARGTPNNDQAGGSIYSEHATPRPILQDDITAAMRDASRNVAIAKLSQFEIEAALLGGMAQRNPLHKREVVDCLYEIATANSLLTTHGAALIEGLIAVGLEAR